jgi:hypothetical protein
MKKLFFLLFSIISFSTNLFAAADEIPKAKQTLIDKKQLAAWGQTFGNKTANLKMLKKLASQFKNVAVPDFFGISHEEMVSFLTEKNEWATISSLWSAFQNSIKDQSGLPEESKEILSKLRSIVETVDYSDLYELLTYRKLLEKKRVEKEKAFIEKAIKEKYLLMIRSTGLEDGKELSNAGGNESVASVSPDHHAISDAIKKVLSSYFSEKSIMQRIIGKDQNLRSGEPFVPALMQYMIGEGSGVDANLIPRSGVIYSTEGEGNTQDLTVIQATWGHNEAVVNGLAPVDSYYVDTYLHIFPVIYRKYHRLKTINGQLEKVSNESTTINNKPLFSSSTLTKSHVLKLKHISNRLEKVYGHPVDIEFVIQGKTTFLVQVRPIETKELRPSFLDKDFFNKLAPTDSIKATMIGVGDAATQIIADRNEVIVADNIRSALKEYLAALSVNEKAKEQIKAIIVNEMAPSTSHEANQFRGQQKPVFYLENLDQINELMQNKIRFFADPQRSCLVACPEKIVPQKVIQEGWFVHPIPARVSLLSSFLDKIKLPTLQKIKPSKANNIPQLLQAIKEGSTKEAEKACDTLLALTLQTIHAKMDKEQINSSLKEELFLLAKQFSIAIEAQKATLKNRKSTDIQMLYPLTFINALLKQLPEKELIDQYSLGSLIKTDRQERQLAENIDTVPHREYLIQYQKAKEFGLTRFIKVQWKKFTKTITEEENQQFARMLHQISSLEMLPLWINVSFVKTIDEENQKQLLFDEFAASKGFLDQCSEIKKEFQAINPAAFNDPALFKKQWASLSELLNKTVCSENFIEDLTVSPQLGRLAALSIMQTVVDVFDNSIKALTGSTLYQKDELHVQRFKTMVDQYFFMFTQWTKIKHIQNELNTLCPYINGSSTMQTYNNQLKKYLDQTTLTRKEFLSNFNVAGGTLGSKAIWSRNFNGKTINLESLFSLIHQNLLLIVATLGKIENIEQTIEQPILLENFINNIKKLSIYDPAPERRNHIPINLIGIFFNKDLITFLYNIPIRNHSNTFNIIYNLKTEKISFEATFIGNDTSRWETMGGALYVLSHYYEIPLSKKIDINSIGTISFGLEIQNKTDALIVPIILQAFAEWSCLTDRLTENIYGYFEKKLKQHNYLNPQFIIKLKEMINNKGLLLKRPSILVDNNAFSELLNEYEEKQYANIYIDLLLNYYKQTKRDIYLERTLLKKIEKFGNAELFCKKFIEQIDSLHLKKADFLTTDYQDFFSIIFPKIKNPSSFVLHLLKHHNIETEAVGLSILTKIPEDLYNEISPPSNILYPIVLSIIQPQNNDFALEKALLLWQRDVLTGNIVKKYCSSIFSEIKKFTLENLILYFPIVLDTLVRDTRWNYFTKEDYKWLNTKVIEIYPFIKKIDTQNKIFTFLSSNIHEIDPSIIIEIISKTHFDSSLGADYRYSDFSKLFFVLSQASLLKEDQEKLISIAYTFIQHGTHKLLTDSFSNAVPVTIIKSLNKKYMEDPHIDTETKKIIFNYMNNNLERALEDKKITKTDLSLIKALIQELKIKHFLEDRDIKSIESLIENY